MKTIEQLSFSVIICTRNRPNDMVACLDSLLIQDLQPDEVIVVDSSDDTKVEEVVKTNNYISLNLHYIHSEPGLTRQRNIGVAYSKVDILFFLDDDVVLEPSFCKNIISDFKEDKSHAIGGIQGIDLNIDILEKINHKYLLFCRTFLLNRSDCYGKLHASGNVSHLNEGLKEVRFSKTNLRTYILCGGYVAYRRQVFEKFTFDQNYSGYSHGEDVDFSHRVSKKYKLYFNPNARAYHNQNTEKLNWYNTEEYIISHLKANIYLFRKHFMKNPLNYIALFWSWCGWLFWIGCVNRNRRRFIWCLNAINNVKWTIFKNV